MSLPACAVLALPLTPTLLADPHPLLPTIYKSVSLASQTLTVVFTGSTYASLRRSPDASWDALQRFLGNVYATLAAAQWAVGRVDMEVEVHFEGEDGEVRDKVGEPDLTLHLHGYDLPAYMEGVGAETRTLAVPARLSAPAPASPAPAPADSGFPVVALGGTFDHLHAAHKLLLHLALFLATRKVIVGVVADRLLGSKSDATLVQPIDARLEAVRAFLRRCGATTETAGESAVYADVVEIADALGPTAHDPDIDALVVSRETVSGGEGVNRARRAAGLRELETRVVDVISSTLSVERVVRADDAADAEAADGDEEDEAERRRGGADVDLDSVRTVDLSGVDDEATLKEMKMGSTAIRAWLAQRGEQ